MKPRLRLYHYWRSTSSWRVRWAFAIKKIDCEFVHVDLLNGESESPSHLARNPLGYVPVLEFLDGESSAASPGFRYLAESVALLEWAEQVHPAPPLLPSDPYHRARVRQLVELINSDTQPLQNLNPQILHSDDPQVRKRWAQHWIQNGLAAYETLVSATAGKFSFGDELTLADICLVPQCYNAERYEVDLARYPTVSRIHQLALQTESCKVSAPEAFKPKPN